MGNIDPAVTQRLLGNLNLKWHLHIPRPRVGLDLSTCLVQNVSALRISRHRCCEWIGDERVKGRRHGVADRGPGRQLVSQGGAGRNALLGATRDKPPPLSRAQQSYDDYRQRDDKVASYKRTGQELRSSYDSTPIAVKWSSAVITNKCAMLGSTWTNGIHGLRGSSTTSLTIGTTTKPVWLCSAACQANAVLP